MKYFRELLLILAIVCACFFGSVQKANAIAASLWVDNIDIINDENSIMEGKAVYSYDNGHVLTLNNYEGTEIIYDLEEDLTIVLKGTNVLTGSLSSALYSYGNITIKGDGTLKIVSAASGIYMSDSKLDVNNTNLVFNNLEEEAIYVVNNDLSVVNSNIVIENITDDDAVNIEDGSASIIGGELSFKNIDGTAIVADSDITIESKIIIDNARIGLHTDDGSITLNGDVNMTVKCLGINGNIVTVNGGKINIVVTDLGGTDVFNAGIQAFHKIKFNDGYVHVKTNEYSPAIVLLSLDGEVSLEVAEGMSTKPDKYGIKNFILDLGDDEKYPCTTFGINEVSGDFFEVEPDTFVFRTINAVNEIEIGSFEKEKEEVKEETNANPKTGDNIGLYLIVGFSTAVLGTYTFMRFRKM